MGERHAEDRVAGLQKRQKDGAVGLSARMGLHIGKVAAKELLGAVDGELLGNIDVFATAVIAPARITFRVLVGQDRALGLQHRRRDDVFRGNKLNLIALAMKLTFDGLQQFWIAVSNPAGKEIRRRNGLFRDGHGRVLQN